MKNYLFMLLICLLGISNVNAQLSASSEKTSVRFNPSPVKTDGPQFRAATDGLPYFGYCDDNVRTGVPGQTAELSAAICMPASLSGFYAGKKITKIRIGVGSNCSNVSSVWIRSSLTGANLMSQAVGQGGHWSWIEITLSTPFTIPASDFYIGYTAASGGYPIGFSGKPVSDGCWFYDGKWENVVDQKWGSACIQALIDMQGTTVLALNPESMPKTAQSILNKNFSIEASVKSYSSVDITNVKVSYQIDNQTAVERIIQTSVVAMKEGVISIPINTIASTGVYQLSVKCLEINGKANPFANKSLRSEVRIVSQSFPRKVVMEEGTGTWCGWCIRGFVGMAMMKAKYPNTYIGIAVHNADAMTVTEYDSYMTKNFIDGFPGAVFDRKTELISDPHPDLGAESRFQSEMKETPIAGIQLIGGFTNSNKSAISLKTTTTFGLSSNNANFRLAYVLIENGITGYPQTNFYAGGDVVMGGYEKKPETITNMVYNDVARGIYASPTGIQGSIPASITGMKPIEHTYTINLPASIKDKNQLEVVVMLLHANTGEIENADIVKINGIYTDIPVLTANTQANVYLSNQNWHIKSEVSETIDIYTASGVKVYTVTKTSGVISVSSGRLPKGVLIVQGSSGWVRKVVNN